MTDRLVPVRDLTLAQRWERDITAPLDARVNEQTGRVAAARGPVPFPEPEPEPEAGL